MTKPPESADDAAKRRSRLRWVTLGEAVAIAAVIISALGLWNSYEERRQTIAERSADATRSTSPAPFYLKAVASGDGATLILTPVVADQAIQSQTVRFPPGFALAPVTTTSDARIEAGWFADALKRNRKTLQLPDQTAGDARLPVMIETDYLAGGRPLRARAFYDVGYALEGRFLRGSSIKLRGLSLIGRAPAADASVDRALARLWKARSAGHEG